MTAPRVAKAKGLPLYVELYQALRGAIADCEAMEASGRARWLRAAVDGLAVLGRWAAIAWLVLLVVTVVGAPFASDPATLLSSRLEHRDAVFVVLALALAGPIAVALVAWLSLFGFRVAVDALARRLPRAFRYLTQPGLLLVIMATLWSYRDWLHAGFWRAYGEIAMVLDTAGRFTPVVG